MNNVSKIEVKNTSLSNNFRIIFNIGDFQSFGYLLSFDDMKALKFELETMINKQEETNRLKNKTVLGENKQ
jgi:hypothetical protein